VRASPSSAASGVDIPLRYEAGDMKARVAFDADEKVASLLILNPDAQ
jgi:hypothetical protein